MTVPSDSNRSVVRRLAATGAIVGVLGCVGVGFSSCNPSGTSAPVGFVSGGPATPLSTADVALILSRALNATDSAFLNVAVVDRTGDILGVGSTASGALTDELNIAVSLARTTAFFSNSQAPLSSRTVETLGAVHFPPTFDPTFVASQVTQSADPAGAGAPAQDTQSVIAPTRLRTGVAGTPQGPLWQINSTNRGALIATATTPPTAFNAGFEYRPSRNVLGNVPFAANQAVSSASFPSPGITLLPGAVPLYKVNAGGVPRLVGGVGVFVRESLTTDPNALPDPAVAEFAAIQGATGSGAVGDENFFLDIPSEGAITIVGILLPYVKQLTLPDNVNAGPPLATFSSVLSPGRVDPFGYLIGPRDGVASFGGAPPLTQAEVTQIIDDCIASADITRAQVRLPLGSSARIIATVVDTDGLILAHFRMEDTLTDAIDVVPAKARSTVYYCRPDGPFSNNVTNNGFEFPFGDAWDGFPQDPTGLNRGIALTTRTLGFLAAPFYPPGIGGAFSQADFIAQSQAVPPTFAPAPGATPPGPLYNLALLNQLPQQVDRWGNDPPSAANRPYRNGLTFFPGSVPLYKEDVNGVRHLVGALGVSGDGVEQNDLIAFEGGRRFAPPPELRIDNFEYLGVKLPYVKFPETPR